MNSLNPKKQSGSILWVANLLGFTMVSMHEIKDPIIRTLIAGVLTLGVYTIGRITERNQS